MRKVSLRLVTLSVGSYALLSAVLCPGAEYISPDFLHTLKKLEAKEVESESGFSPAVAIDLCNFAINLRNDPKEQAKALILAWSVADDSGKSYIIEADFFIRLGEFPQGNGDKMGAKRSYEGVPSDTNLKFAGQRLLSIAKGLKRERADGKNGDRERMLAAYVFDLLQNKNLSSTIRKEAEDGLSSLHDFTPSWEGVRGGTVTSDVNTKAKFSSKQSLIKGLLVVDLGASEYAGQASQMNATVVDGLSETAPTQIKFNQAVGDSMRSALEEAQKFLSVRHDGLPPGKRVEIAFEEQYSSKDGPSAAVACTLLLDSLISGDKFDTAFAVTGDMNADGSVQPVGGIDGKIRGATKRNCTHVAIPRQNVGLLSDMIVVNDLRPLIAIQVFSIGKFDEALALAKDSASRDPKLQQAITTFAEVQKVLLRPNGQNLLTNSHVRGRLQKVLAAAPNHESARLLLLKSTGRVPKQLSLRGSFAQIDKVTKPIMKVLETGKLDNAAKGLKDSVFALRRVRRKLDDRAKPTADALEGLSVSLEALEATKLGGRSERVQVLLRDFKAALSRVQTEYNKLAANPDIQEELIK